jgi:PBP1b-binding outer membrane lipoprotein LpoB
MELLYTLKHTNMKKLTVLLLIVFAMSSCVRYLTPYQAAQKSQKCGRTGVR